MCTSANGVLHFLQQIPDPRGRKGRRHSLAAMLAATVCSVLCGAKSFAAIAEWIHAQEIELRHALGFTRNPPTQNAWRNLLEALDPEVLEEALSRWVDTVWENTDVATEKPTMPVDTIDGKVLKGAISKHGRTMCLLTRVDQATGRVLSQSPVDIGDGEKKGTNEHKTALTMLKALVLEGKLTGRLIVGDAAFCQRDICRTIDEAGGYYLLDVKENQPKLRKTLELAFCKGRAFSPLPQAFVGG